MRTILTFGLAAAGLTVALTALAQDDAAPTPELTEAQKLACQSHYGPDDQAGAANILTPEMVKRATDLVEEGKVYSLGVETNSTTPAFGTRNFQVVVMAAQPGGTTLGPTDLVYNDDMVVGWLGIGSQLDGLGHIGIDNMYYGCNPGSEIVTAAGLTKLGIEQVPNMVTRGVVLDMTAHFGESPLPMGTAINVEEMEAQAEAQGVTIERGDIVFLHTGWLSMVEENPSQYLMGEPGLGVEGARWLVDKGVVAVGADSWGLEVVPFEEGTGVFEVHQILLAMNGVYILENMNTATLVEDGVSEFMFVLGQPKMTGAVQAIINPTAIR